MPKPAVFLDRDGVINVPTGIPHTYVTSWKRFEFLPRVFEGLRLLQESGYLLIVVTNQRGIARDVMTQDVLDDIHARMCAQLEENGIELDGIYVCPHDYGQCHCRKPDIGLFEQAEEEHLIDKRSSFIIGDDKSDMEAGRNFGIRTVYVGKKPIDDALIDFSCENLLDAAKTILREELK